MDWQYYSIIILLGIVILSVFYFGVVPNLPEVVSEKQLEAYWGSCDEPTSVFQQADCELMQKIVDLNAGG